MYEAFTNEWRGLGNAINKVEDPWQMSVVCLNQSILLLKRVDLGLEDGELSLLSHIDV